jgi:hypothetical protein
VPPGTDVVPAAGRYSIEKNNLGVLVDMKSGRGGEEIMKATGRYDSRLQMFVDEPREVDMARLAFLRWMVEHGLLEHRPAGPSSGEFARPVPRA